MKANSILKTATGLFILAALLLGCKKTGEEPSSHNPDLVDFSSNIQSESFRVADNKWNASDAIGVFMMKAGETIDKAIKPVNAKYITPTAGATATFKAAGKDNELHFSNGAATANFIAYYPYSAEVKENKLALNVTDQSNFAAIDYLYSNNLKGVTKETGAKKLDFKYLLPILEFKFKDNAGATIASSAIRELKIKGLKTAGALNLADGSVKASDEATELAANDNGKAIVVPQKATALAITFSYKGKSYTWDIGAKTFEKGKRYTFTAKLLGGTVESVGNIGGEISNREEGGITGEGTNLNPEGETPGGEEGSDLIISAYAEGKGYDKYIQIYNPTGKTITLDGVYKLAIWTNGLTEKLYTLELTGMMKAGAVIVFHNPKATFKTTFPEGVKVIVNDKVLNFNGNDPLAILKGEKAVDMFGSLGDFATTEWGDAIFHRKANIKNPSAAYKEVEWTKTPGATFDATIFDAAFGQR